MTGNITTSSIILFRRLIREGKRYNILNPAWKSNIIQLLRENKDLTDPVEIQKLQDKVKYMTLNLNHLKIMEPIETFERIKSNLKDGRYENPFGHIVTMSEVFKWFKERRQYYPVKPLTEEEKRDIHPVLNVNFELLESEYNHENTIRSTWIGHSTTLIQLEGFNFLTDPVWSKRCTPFPSLPMGPARYTEPACKISELPKIDFVVISHTHYDHLDYHSVCEIYKLYKPTFFVPKGMRQWFLDAGINDVQELDWWEETTFRDNLTLIYTPVNHSSQRGLLDKNKALWGGWIVKGKHQKFYFAGDTAYNDKLFKVIGHHYGPFNYSLIPIGAYDLVRSFMRHNHIDPEEAVMIHKEIKSKRSFGIHWGTFILTCEPLLEPPKKLREEAHKQGLKENEFFVSKIGETSIIITEDKDESESEVCDSSSIISNTTATTANNDETQNSFILDTNNEIILEKTESNQIKSI